MVYIVMLNICFLMSFYIIFLNFDSRIKGGGVEKRFELIK